MESFLQADQKFCSFFHDGKVSTEVGIQYGIKTELFECIDHFPRYPFTRVISKIFTKSYSDSRGRLDNHMLIGIIYCVPHIVDICFFNQSTGGAAVDTLSAVCANNMAHGPVVER